MDSIKPAAGVLVPVFALRRPGDLGIGDTQAMLEAIEFCVKNELGLLQVLPINETGDDHSPYNAISSVALDPVYLTMTPDEIPGLSQEIIDELVPPELLAEISTGPVNYPKVKSLKFYMLTQAYVNFESGEGQVAEDLYNEFDQFCNDHSDWLVPYTLFRTLLNQYDGNPLWTNWSPEHQTFADANDWVLNTPTALDEDGEFYRYRLFTAFCQWICWRQWQGVRAYADDLNIKLIGDIPFGISRYSADVWADRDLFDMEWSGGAPPEPFFTGDKFLKQWGQNWGIPLYNWDAHRAQDFAWWKQRVYATGSIFHSFRIDHVLGFFRIWSFPWLPQDNDKFIDLTKVEASKLTEGRIPQFVPNPDIPEEMGELNAIHGKSLLSTIMEAAGSTIIIAEDLGMTPAYVPKALEELDIAGFTLPHFQKDKVTGNFVPASEFHKRTVATWGTHDHAPLKEWYEDLATRWHGPNGHEPWLELQRIMRFIGWDENKPPRTFTPELHKALLKTLLESPADWVIFTICDVFNLDLRFNSPGTAGGSNWSQRLSGPMEDFFADPVTDEILTFVKTTIKESGRDIPPVVYQEQIVEDQMHEPSEHEPAEQEPGEPTQEAGDEEPDISRLEAEARAMLIERELAEKSSKIELPKVERPKE